MRKKRKRNEGTDSSDHCSHQDVLMGRGKRVSEWPGNVYFRQVIRRYRNKYNAATRSEKVKIAETVVEAIAEVQGLFLKEESEGKWTEVEHNRALEKACQALREKPALSHPDEPSSSSDRASPIRCSNSDKCAILAKKVSTHVRSSVDRGRLKFGESGGENDERSESDARITSNNVDAEETDDSFNTSEDGPVSQKASNSVDDVHGDFRSRKSRRFSLISDLSNCHSQNGEPSEQEWSRMRAKLDKLKPALATLVSRRAGPVMWNWPTGARGNAN